MGAKTISTLLGHTSVAFTLDTYAHVLPNMKKQAIELLEGNYILAKKEDSIYD